MVYVCFFCFFFYYFIFFPLTLFILLLTLFIGSKNSPSATTQPPPQKQHPTQKRVNTVKKVCENTPFSYIYVMCSCKKVWVVDACISSSTTHTFILFTSPRHPDIQIHHLYQFVENQILYKLHITPLQQLSRTSRGMVNETFTTHTHTQNNKPNFRIVRRARITAHHTLTPIPFCREFNSLQNGTISIH